MRARRAPLVAALILGLALAAAPLVLSMFSRAPGGGRMIDAFEPYMTEARLDRFDGFLDTISAAHGETTGAALAQSRYQGITELNRQWPSIDADMSSMLGDIRANIGNYRAVSALPPFALFPYFFVLPGLGVAGLAAWALRTGGRPQIVAVALMGLAIVAAPAVFQMFSRAPAGAAMIDDFRPLMTPARITTIQGYFLTIGTAEGELRTEALPEAGTTPPAVGAFVGEWPEISAEMAPMIGVMSDNLGNFAGVAALPPFSLFPWFFVLPGLIVAGLAAVAYRRDPASASPEPLAAPRPVERSIA